jgi:L-threonylcarbamoyladenylate synthase
VSAGRVVSIERDGAEAARSALQECVAGGGVALFPADGVYGLCCDPLNERGVGRIHELKGRDARKPSAVMYFSPLAMRELVSAMGERTRAAAGALLPGPVTLVIDNAEHRYPLACREDPGRLGVRLIEGPLAGMPLPVFQTSANPSGGESPAAFAELDPRISGGADLAIDGGELPGVASTVIDLTELDSGGHWRLLREGGMPAGEVERMLAAAVAEPEG